MQDGGTIREAIRSCIDDFETWGLCPGDAGIAIGICSSQGVVFQDAFGLRDRNQHLQTNIDTLFSVSSLTKGFSAMACLMAQEAGHLDLHQPINRDTSYFELADPEVSRAVTFSDILSHRVGLPANDLLWLLSDDDRGDLCASLPYLELIHEGFRSCFTYNNLLYAAMEGPFKTLTGETISKAISNWILRPLGMERSVLSQQNARTDGNTALPYSGERELPARNADRVWPAGGLYANIQDMCRWLICHLNGGRDVHGGPLVNTEMLSEGFQSHVTVKDQGPFLLQGLEWLGTDLSYGYGWFVGECHGHPAFFHPGLIDGYSSAIALFPTLNLGYVVLTNLNLSPVPGLLIRRMVHRAIGISDEDVVTAPTAPMAAGPVPRGKTDDFLEAGQYRDAAYGDLAVVEGAESKTLHFRNHCWTPVFQSPRDFTISINVFGLQLPMVGHIVSNGKECSQVCLPLSLDPRVAPRRFYRVN